MPHPRETIHDGTENHTRYIILRNSIVPGIGQYQFYIFIYFEVVMLVPVRKVCPVVHVNVCVLVYVSA